MQFNKPHPCAQSRTEVKGQRTVNFCFLLILSVLLVGSWSVANADPNTSSFCSSGCTRQQNSGLDAGDPVSASNGAYHFDLPLLSLGGPMNLNFTLHYCSDLDQAFSVIGVPYRFWWYPLETMEYDRSLFATIQIHNGDAISFKKPGELWVPTEGDDFGVKDNIYPAHWGLQETNDYFYLMDPIGEQVHVFYKKSNYLARIARIVDRNGNQLIYSYAGSNEMYPSRVEDSLGRSLDFTYQTVGDDIALVRVTDQAGRQVSLTNEAQGADNDDDWTLRSVTDPMGQTTTFHYTWVEVSKWSIWTHMIIGVEQPAGNVPYAQTYEIRTLHGGDAVRITSQQDAYGNTTTLAYDPNDYIVTETRSDGTTQVYEHYSHHGLPKSLTDPAGKVIRFSRDAVNNRLTSVTDRLGDTTRITYHSDTGKIASTTDAEGHTTTFTYSAQNQVITNPANGENVTFTFYNIRRITYADGSHEDFTYDGHGNVLTYTDRSSKKWHYTYNDRGLVLTATNPAGGITTFTYNADATLAGRTDSDVGITTYSYDAYKRLSRITRPDNSTVRPTYDLNNRLQTVNDERGKTTTFAYDDNGSLISHTDPLNHAATYAYDLMDRPASRTDPLGHISTYDYDEMGQLNTITNRNGNITAFTYDPRGWRTGMTDPLGKTWLTTHDDEEVPSSITTPLGLTTTYLTDKLGRTTLITDPMGEKTQYAYETLGRLTSVTDRMERSTDYEYDTSGRLISATGPVVGSATYTRNDMGQLSRIMDMQGNEWDFGRSPMGRLVWQTDPLGREYSYTYDARGRLQRVTSPDGDVSTITYDETSRVTQITYSDGLSLNYTYDDAGRLLTADNLMLTYDARGDITNSKDGAAGFSASYDAGRRLKTVTYDGRATVTYAYDKRSLLARVEDDLSNTWMEFTYDDDGRLTEIRRSNGVSTTFTYDNAGRVTRIQDGALADQQYILNAEGEPAEAVMNVPLGGGTIRYAYDGAGRLTGADYGGDNQLALVYDAAGNLLSRSGTTPLDPALAEDNYDYDAAAQISSAGFEYDARGRQTAAPGKTVSYDGASRLTSITADANNATFTYNGLGDLCSRTAGGAATYFYHNYALGLSPIVAEKEDTLYKRLYVYTPGGRLLYSIDPASGQVCFYHFDRLGSTLFLTDGGGQVTDTFAYSPYGRLLSHTGTSDQPFTFIGRYSVRRESVGDLYDMRARAYEPATARFLTRDPVWPMVYIPKSLNPYQYASQNPLRHIDPKGKQVSGGFLPQPPQSGRKSVHKWMDRWMDQLVDKMEEEFWTVEAERVAAGLRTGDASFLMLADKITLFAPEQVQADIWSTIEPAIEDFVMNDALRIAAGLQTGDPAYVSQAFNLVEFWEQDMPDVTHLVQGELTQALSDFIDRELDRLHHMRMTGSDRFNAEAQQFFGFLDMIEGTRWQQ